MRRGLRRSLRILVFVGALAPATPALAQSVLMPAGSERPSLDGLADPIVPVRPAPDTRQAPTPFPTRAPLTAPTPEPPRADWPGDRTELTPVGRMEEMKVEMAWLADAATFAYPLSARCTGNALEVRGYLPSDVVKQRALEVARRTTHLTVMDALRVHPSLATRSPADISEALRHGALDLLTAGFGDRVRAFTIEAAPDGQLTISGSVGSVEEKLFVSTRLRQLPGCTCVINRLAVVPVQRDGRAMILVSADGSYSLPHAADPRGMTPSPQTPPEPAPLPPSVPPAPVMTPVPSSTDTLAVPLPTIVHTKPSPPARPASRPANIAVPYQAPSTPAATAPRRESSDPLTAPTLPPGWFRGTPAQTPARPGVLPDEVARPAAGSSAGRTAGRAPADYPSATPVAAPQQPAVPSPGPALPYGYTVPAPVRETSRLTPVPAVPSTQPAPQNITRTTAAVTSAPAIHPLSVSPAVPISTGTVSEPAGPPDPTALQRTLKAVCVGLAREVEVVQLTDNTVLVRIQAGSSGAERALTEKVLSLPQMMSPHVRLRIDILP
jgi:hypothetical protein